MRGAKIATTILTCGIHLIFNIKFIFNYILRAPLIRFSRNQRWCSLFLFTPAFSLRLYNFIQVYSIQPLEQTPLKLQQSFSLI